MLYNKTSKKFFLIQYPYIHVEHSCVYTLCCCISKPKNHIHVYVTHTEAQTNIINIGSYQRLLRRKDHDYEGYGVHVGLHTCMGIHVGTLMVLLCSSSAINMSRVMRKPMFWGQGYKTFFMLNSVELKIYHSHKC